MCDPSRKNDVREEAWRSTQSVQAFVGPDKSGDSVCSVCTNIDRRYVRIEGMQPRERVEGEDDSKVVVHAARRHGHANNYVAHLGIAAGLI
jgi:hypothetical protein